MIDYMKDMKKRGYIGSKEVRFLESGIMFNTIKLAIFGFRPDDLMERKHLIKQNKYWKLVEKQNAIKRPDSSSSKGSQEQMKRRRQTEDELKE